MPESCAQFPWICWILLKVHQAFCHHSKTIDQLVEKGDLLHLDIWTSTSIRDSETSYEFNSGVGHNRFHQTIYHWRSSVNHLVPYTRPLYIRKRVHGNFISSGTVAYLSTVSWVPYLHRSKESCSPQRAMITHRVAAKGLHQATWSAWQDRVQERGR